MRPIAPLAVLAAVSALALATPASAHDEIVNGRLTARVDASGFDTATPSGRAALLRRAALVGADLCEQAAGPGGLAGYYDGEARACRAAAAAQVRSQIDASTSGSATTLGMVTISARVAH